MNVSKYLTSTSYYARIRTSAVSPLRFTLRQYSIATRKNTRYCVPLCIYFYIFVSIFDYSLVILVMIQDEYIYFTHVCTPVSVRTTVLNFSKQGNPVLYRLFRKARALLQIRKSSPQVHQNSI